MEEPRNVLFAEDVVLRKETGMKFGKDCSVGEMQWRPGDESQQAEDRVVVHRKSGARARSESTCAWKILSIYDPHFHQRRC